MIVSASNTSSAACIIYVKRTATLFDDMHLVAMAQAEALKLHLPFAVVYCAVKPTPKVKEQLMETERLLQAYGVPLIALVGDTKITLAAIVHHTKPKRIFYEEDSKMPNSTVSLKQHIHPWPGTVIGIEELFALDNYC
ncbi:MAG TPA: hypothetical protein PKA02_04130 [Candidatus Saccharibacteria bacterium]|nr:hypothetical protein [Candidatus Saccharibacteria bacterium]